MDNGLCGWGGEKLSYAADLMYLVIGHLTDRIYVGVKCEAIVKKDP